MILTSALLGLALVQSQLTAKPLNIGDPAPAFRPEATLKGNAFKGFQKGKVYVLEFWATWCGPCIEAMPHLSQLADKERGKVEFYSVNVWDRNEPGEKTPNHAGHRDRVAAFVKQNDANMRFNVVLDDAKDTISMDWLLAANRTGIPCTFVVNQEGKVAWIGHPMMLDKPLKEIQARTFDIAAFKTKFDAENAAMLAEQRLSQEVIDAAAKGDLAAFEAVVRKLPGTQPEQVQTGIQLATVSNPELAFNFLESSLGKVKIKPASLCSMLAYIARSSKSSETKTKAVDLSAKIAEGCETKDRPAVLAHHARVLGWAGRKEEGLSVLEKATAAAEAHEPASEREGLKGLIASIRKMISG